MLETETLTPAETVTPIKPSEAIRLGSLTTQQGFGTDDTLGRAGFACAMQAMDAEMDVTLDVFEWLSRPCPDGHVFGGDGWDMTVGPTVVAHLNDDHRWSRERIADWLAEQGL